MENTLGKSEIPNSELLYVFDSSKLKDYQQCPRKFLISHVFGWRSKTTGFHLVFGSAWHDAMEHLLNHGYGSKIVLEAFELFMETYNKGVDPLMDHAAKNPQNVMSALIEYTIQYATDKFATLHTEVYGAVPVREDRMFHVKLDSILEMVDGIYSMEHKTGQRLTQAWQDQWALSVQPGAYNYALWMLFPDKPVQGVIINGAIFRKTGNAFVRIPVRRDITQLEAHVVLLNNWLDKIEDDFGRLADSSPDQNVLNAFPISGEGCSMWGCPFKMLCGVVNNPLRVRENPPPGHVVQFWDPRNMAEEANAIIADGKIQKKEVIQDVKAS